jgi:hypothetical protein
VAGLNPCMLCFGARTEREEQCHVSLRHVNNPYPNIYDKNHERYRSNKYSKNHSNRVAVKWPPSWFPIGRHEQFNVVLTFAIALLTAGNVGVSFWYASITKRAAEDSGRQTQRLISAANIQASAATKNATSAQQSAQAASDFAIQAHGINTQTEAAVRQFQRIAGDSERAMNASVDASRLDQRPWVGLQVVQCNGCTIAEDRSLNVQDLVGVIANTGKTPALQMIIDNDVAINALKSDPIPDWPSIERRRKDEEERAFRVPQNAPPDMAAEIAKTLEKVKRDIAFRKSVSVLPPNGTRVLHFVPSFKVTREMFPNRDNERVTYVIGRITYFDRDRQHTTTFCMVNDLGIDFRFCSTGNDMN